MLRAKVGKFHNRHLDYEPKPKHLHHYPVFEKIVWNQWMISRQRLFAASLTATSLWVLNQYQWNLLFDVYTESCLQNLNLIRIGHTWLLTYLKVISNFWIFSETISCIIIL